jgi:butyrate kinase
LTYLADITILPKKYGEPMKYRVLAINPGSTSTKIAVFDDDKPVFVKTLRHDAAEINSFDGIIEQYEFRKDLVLKAMAENNVSVESLKAVVGRGGLVKALASGTYRINEAMLTDLQDPSLWGRIHASNLGAFIAHTIAADIEIPSFIVDPVTVDEFSDIARISGFPEIERRSLLHALNIKFTARLLAEEAGKELNDLNLIGVHMGGGISVVAIHQGRMIDVNNAVLGMGSFSPQRAGALPIGDLLELAYSGKYTYKELVGKLTKTGGLIAYLGTDDCPEIVRRIKDGDEKAKLIFDAMCYQISKEIGASATVLKGKVDAVFLTGGLAYNTYAVDQITSRVEFIAPLHIFPGEKEMEALTQGAVRILKGLETAKEYV